ncbi:hypothetical protein B296_00037722 [Ensete ventricosum]|uniref:Uncharacterized protein n=1 Tax=Ensete ventricosum TaxID=4639 RepID=A0A426XVE6_ENSVE|nr:hypothetical protein B296_00037722 [Ensete ventricosum]
MAVGNYPLMGAALQVVMPVGCCPYGLALAASSHRLAGGLGHSRSPLCRGPWPQPAAPVGGLVVASHPCRWPSHDRLPTVLIAFTTKTQQERRKENRRRWLKM